jgi:hypothetical protein
LTAVAPPGEYAATLQRENDRLRAELAAARDAALEEAAALVDAEVVLPYMASEIRALKGPTR